VKNSIKIGLTLLLFVIVSIFIVLNIVKSDYVLKTRKFKINNRSLTLEVAITNDEKITGLQRREKINKNSGMLFVYDKEQFLRFWMKDTFIPLDLAYLNINGEIVEIISVSHDMTQLMNSLEEVKRSKKAKEDFFINISHEMKTPLNSILGFSSLLKNV